MADEVNLPRNPSLKRSWLDLQAGDDTETGSSDVENSTLSSRAMKRCRESSTEGQGTDTGYSSGLSEAQDAISSESSLPAQQKPDSTYHSECTEPNSKPDDGVWFKAESQPVVESSSEVPEQPEPSREESESQCQSSKAEADGEEEEAAVDNLSDISGFSDNSLDGEGWRPMSGPMQWVHRQMLSGADPRELLKRLIPDCSDIPESFSDLALWKIVLQIVTEPPRRKKLDEVNTLMDVVNLIRSSRKIMVLTGAGVSVSCGIPDFRSKDGVYARLSVEYPDLPDPQAMFDISYFLKNPRPFFKFAKELYPGQFKPSLCHNFISMVEKQGHLLRNYTQNIDTLEQVAGIEKVLQCHGSFATATCLVCKNKVDADVIREDIMNQVIPHCSKCGSEQSASEDQEAIMKPDIVFFGESLPQEFHNQMDIDKDDCDLLIVIGSSLKVRPVALIPNSLPAHVPQVLINREPLKHLTFDVELLGDCDVIVNELCHLLGEEWSALCRTSSSAAEISMSELATPSPSPPPPSLSAVPSVPHVDSSSNMSVIGKLEQTHISNEEEKEEQKEEQQLSDAQIEDLRSAYQPRKINIASKLKDDTYLFLPPNRYVFSGAEVYDDEDDDNDDDSMSSFKDSDDNNTSSNEATAAESSTNPKETENAEDTRRHFEVFADSTSNE